MPRDRRDKPMPVKYWSFAGLMLTNWCNARCANCYVRCGPHLHREMTVEFALAVWEDLARASPHGCRIHIAGGEPFGNWPLVHELVSRAKDQGLGPLEKVETNAFWAVDEKLIRDRVRVLDAAGMGRLVVSTDPYHQQFVPIERPRLAARIATEILGPRRVQVRWQDWLTDGYDTDLLAPEQRRRLFLQTAATGRDRMIGRASTELAKHLQLKPTKEFADDDCRSALLRSRHVHVGPAGELIPGTCAGITLATLGALSVGDAWRQLDRDHNDRPIVGVLADTGPCGLLAEAVRCGYRPRAGYASKCHLCWDVRSFFASRGMHSDEVGPPWIYEPENSKTDATSDAAEQ